MKRTSADTKFILITLSLVTLLGVQTFRSLMEEDIQLPTSVAEASTASSSRAPASIPSDKSISKVSTSVSSLLGLDLSCKKNKDSDYKISGNFVQLKGKNCLKNFKQEKMEIVNRSNGYTAAIFPFGRNQYQTDMIQLVEGENEIHIRYVTPGSPSFEEIIKVRATSI